MSVFPVRYSTQFQNGVPDIEVTTQFTEQFYLFISVYLIENLMIHFRKLIRF